MLEGKKSAPAGNAKPRSSLDQPLYKRKLRPQSISNLMDSNIDRMKKQLNLGILSPF